MFLFQLLILYLLERIRMKYIISVLFLLCLVACDALMGEEIARVPVNKLSTENEQFIEQTTLSLEANSEISFWTDLDLKYEGALGLMYKVDVWKDSVRLGGMDLDALNPSISMMEVRTEVNDKVNWSFQGKLGEITLEEPGEYTFKIILLSSDNPSLSIEKSDFLLKK